MRRALRVAEDGTVTELDLDAPEGVLKVLQTAVGGYIEPVTLSQTLEFYCDEEGLYYRTVHNGVAEMLMRRFLDGYVSPILGPVVFTGGIDDEGDTLGISDEGLHDVYATSTTFQLLGNGIVWG